MPRVTVIGYLYTRIRPARDAGGGEFPTNPLCQVAEQRNKCTEKASCFQKNSDSTVGHSLASVRLK